MVLPRHSVAMVLPRHSVAMLSVETESGGERREGERERGVKRERKKKGFTRHDSQHPSADSPPCAHVNESRTEKNEHEMSAVLDHRSPPYPIYTTPR